MQISLELDKKAYRVALGRPHDISIPVRFDDKQLSVFGSEPARMEAHQAEGFIGDVGQGGSCNCPVMHFSAHLHGTHTECVGHLTREPIAVCDVVKDAFIPSTLISVMPEEARKTKDSYDPAAHPSDPLITADALEARLLDVDPNFLEALVIRTFPNHADKRTRDYAKTQPPYFSIEAMQFLVRLGIRHLLVDMPSIDRLADEGKLTNHHIFWGVEAGSHDAKKPSPKTVTELIYAPEEVADGFYLLNLQVAPIAADAAPSRPLLYTVTL